MQRMQVLLWLFCTYKPDIFTNKQVTNCFIMKHWRGFGSDVHRRDNKQGSSCTTGCNKDAPAVTHFHTQTNTTRTPNTHSSHQCVCLHLHVVGSLHSLEYKQDTAKKKKKRPKRHVRSVWWWPRREHEEVKAAAGGLMKKKSQWPNDKKEVNNDFRPDWTAADLNECGPELSSHF